MNKSRDLSPVEIFIYKLALQKRLKLRPIKIQTEEI